MWGGVGSTTATTNYNLNTNWGPAAAPVGAGQTALFDATGNAAITVTAGPIAPNSWAFHTTAKSFTINGAAVNFSQAGSGGGLINGAFGGSAISIANNLGETVPGVRLQQLGSSTLTLSGTNTYTGPTTIQAGTLIIANSGSITSNVTSDAGFNNAGTVTGSVINNATATFTTTGTVTAGLSNTGTVTASGTLNGAIVNSGAGRVTVSGNLAGAGSFTNTGTARLILNAGAMYTGITTLINNSTAASGIFTGNINTTLSANAVINAAGSTIDLELHADFRNPDPERRHAERRGRQLPVRGRHRDRRRQQYRNGELARQLPWADRQ